MASVSLPMSSQRRPFRIQNYPDIVNISGASASVVVVRQAGPHSMAAGEQDGRTSGTSGSAAGVTMSASVHSSAGPSHGGTAAHRAGVKKGSAPPQRKSHTLPSQSGGAAVNAGTSTSSSGLPGGASGSNRQVTRHWVSSGNVNTQQQQQQQQQQQGPRTKRHAPKNPAPKSPTASAAATRPQTRTQGQTRAPVAGPSTSRSRTLPSSAAATAAGPSASTSASLPREPAAPARAPATGAAATARDHTTPSRGADVRVPVADHSNVVLDVANTTDQPPTSYLEHEHELPPYESRATTINWNEIHEPCEALPDLLNSHRLPPYVPTPRQNHHRHHAEHRRHRGRRHRSSGGGGSSQASRPSPVTDLDIEEKECCSKDCCIDCLTVVTTFRWVLIGLALLGVCCVVSGIILGALHMTVGSSFLTLSLMFIGLGVMLVVVVGVGWRCTPPGHEPCHLLFGLGEHASFDSRRSRMSRPHRDRNQWYGGMMYPEFRYRRPPPSYNAAMQDFQQQLAHAAQMQQHGGAAGGGGDGGQGGANNDNYSLPRSPPPTYRSRASTVRPGIHITFPPQCGRPDFPASGPPTYRSRADPTERSRPSLILENRQSSDSSGGGVDNPGCVVNDGGPGGSGLPLGVENASSTMARVNRVVEYLDGVLEQHQQQQQQQARGGASSSSSASAPASRSASASSQCTPVREVSPASTAMTDASARVSEGDADANEDAESDRVADTPL